MLWPRARRTRWHMLSYPTRRAKSSAPCETNEASRSQTALALHDNLADYAGLLNQGDFKSATADSDTHNRIMYLWTMRFKNLLLVTGHTHKPVFESLDHIQRLNQQHGRSLFTLPWRAGESLLAFATYCFDLRTGF